jgi:hypothetical protein
MLGLFGIFGRSIKLQCLDQALRAVDLHPRLVPESVKLATLTLIEEARGRPATDADFAAASAILGYCMLGAERFAEVNGEDAAEAVEDRVEAAVAEGDSLDARLVLLVMHAGVVQPEVVRRFGLEVA